MTKSEEYAAILLARMEERLASRGYRRAGLRFEPPDDSLPRVELLVGSATTARFLKVALGFSPGASSPPEARSWEIATTKEARRAALEIALALDERLALAPPRPARPPGLSPDERRQVDALLAGMPPPAAAERDPRLAGFWSTGASSGGSGLLFLPDGRLAYVRYGGREHHVALLTWETAGGVLTVDQPSDPGRRQTPYRIEPDGRLLLSAPGRETRYLRIQ